MLWKLGLRNIGRNRRRTLLAGGVVLFGFTSLTLSGSFMRQSFDALREGTIRGGTGHIQIADPALFQPGGDAEALQHALAEGPRAAAIVRENPNVIEVLERIDFFGLITNGDRSVPIVGVGLDPGSEARATDLPSLIDSGQWLAGRDDRAVVIGAGLAGALGARPGQSLTLMAMTADGVLNAIDLEVAGVVRLPVRELDDRYVVTSISAADALLNAGGRVSRLVVMLRDGSAVEETAGSLQGSLRSAGIVAEAKTWKSLAVFYRQVRQLYLGMFSFLGLVLFSIVLLATTNSMLMATAERTREIGTLRALGARPRRVVRLFVVEGFLIGALGCLAGTALSMTVCAVLNGSGLTLPPPPGVAHPIPLHIRFYPTAYLFAAAVMTATVLLASWLPARRASRQRIVDALAHV